MFSALKKKYRLFRYARWRKKYYRRYASLASLGSNTYICDDASLYNLGNISLGNHVWIGHQCYLEGLGGITLGSGTIVGNKVEIISANHNFKGEDITEVPYDKRFIKRPVTIFLSPARNRWGKRLQSSAQRLCMKCHGQTARNSSPIRAARLESRPRSKT